VISIDLFIVPSGLVSYTKGFLVKKTICFFSLLDDSIGFNILRITKQQHDSVLLWLVSGVFLTIPMTSGVAVYQSQRECKVMETQRLRQWERYIQIQDQFEI
jgi:hypothetical protein